MTGPAVTQCSKPCNVQNGLELVTQARQLEAEGMPWRDAVREASLKRLRSKMMTVSCAMLGLLPLVVMAGTGGESEKPMAIVLIGGLVTSTLFTLLALPVALVRACAYRVSLPHEAAISIVSM